MGSERTAPGLWASARLAAYGPPTGRIGQPSSPAVQIILAIITVGIWTFVWVYRQHRDFRDYSGTGVGGGLGLLLYFLAGVVTYFLLPSEVAGLYEREGHPAPVSTVTGFWGFLPLVGSVIWYLKVQHAINEFWYAHGAPMV